MSPRYIFAASHHTLIHGGLGHRPLPSKSCFFSEFFFFGVFEVLCIVSVFAARLVFPSHDLSMKPRPSCISAIVSDLKSLMVYHSIKSSRPFPGFWHFWIPEAGLWPARPAWQAGSSRQVPGLGEAGSGPGRGRRVQRGARPRRGRVGARARPASAAVCPA